MFVHTLVQYLNVPGPIAVDPDIRGYEQILSSLSHRFKVLPLPSRISAF